MPFCTHCGAQIEAIDKYCGSCGTKLNSENQVELIQGAIHNCATGFPSKIYSLFFTDQRIISAKTGRIDSNFTGPGFFSGGALGGLIGLGLDSVISKGSQEKIQHLEDLDPDKLLICDKHNFQIPYQEITEIEATKPNFMGNALLRVKTSDKDYKFSTHIKDKEYTKQLQFIKKMLPEKIT